MSFLPIVERELRAASRRRSTYRTRTLFAVLSSLLAATLLLLGSFTSGRPMGAAVFSSLASLSFLYALCAGARNGADVLSEEKREGTLGLLFLTDLRGFDIIAGKLVSCSARTLQGLLAFYPVLAMSLVLGGTTPSEFWRVTAVLTNTLFFAVATALWVSTVSREVHRALAGTVLLLLLILLAPLALSWSLKYFAGKAAVASLCACLSPATALEFALDDSYRSHASEFWCALLITHAVAWFLLLVAGWQLPTAWQDRPVRAPFELHSVRLKQISWVNQQKASLRRRRLLEVNPIYWLAARNLAQQWFIWIFSGLALLAGILLMILNHFLNGTTLGAATITAFVLGLVLKLWVAWHACATLAEARRTGAAELLLATPITIEQIIRGHWQALQNTFLWPAIAALILRVAPAAEQILNPSANQPVWMLFPFSALSAFGMVTYILDLVALGWVGMWMGLTEPKTIQAFAKTVLLALVLPTVLFCLPNMLLDFFWIVWARRKLEFRFRAAASSDLQVSSVPPPIEFALPLPPTGVPPRLGH